MISTLASVIAVVFYALGVFFQHRNLTSDTPDRKIVLICGTIAVLAHMVTLEMVIPEPGGYDFGFFNVASLFSWVIAVLVLLSSLGKPLENLFIVLFPLAAICLVLDQFTSSGYTPQGGYSAGVGIHILLGILSVSIITIAACQALFLSYVDKQLKEKKAFTLISHLPPLETLEALLFDILLLGLLLLTGVLVTGFLFMDDFFGQHLSHKAVLSFISWIVFCILLWGRHKLGWRGKTANRWILTGFAFLILAYFGSKFVLEIILNRA